MIVRITPEFHIPVPSLETEIGQRKDDRGIDQKIQGTGAVANCSHAANVVNREW